MCFGDIRETMAIMPTAAEPACQGANACLHPTIEGRCIVCHYKRLPPALRTETAHDETTEAFGFGAVFGHFF